MKVAVTGATGLIGRALTLRLLEAGHEVICISRNAARAREVLGLPARYVTWDVSRDEVHPPEFSDAEAVIHLAGEGVADHAWSPERKAQILSSRKDGTARVARAIAKIPSVRVFVSASAIGYFGDRGDEELSVESAPGRDFLSEVCVEWERAARQSQVRTHTVRIGLVLAREGGVLGKLLPIFRAGVGGRTGSGRQWMSWIHLEDVVRLLMAPLDDPQAPRILHGVAPHPVRNSEFTKVLAKAVRKPALFTAPAVALRAALGSELAQVVLSSQRVRASVPEGFQFRFPELKLALSDLCAPEARGEQEMDVYQWVPHPPEKVFPFFSDERNLERITPGFLGFQVLRKSTPEIGEGTLIDYRLKIHGVPARWRTRIEEWVPGVRFVDTQLKGPYKKWHHTHRFQSLGGGTLLRDTVRYVIPAGALGNLALGGLIQKDVQAIFGYRKKVIRELFGGV